MSSRTMFFVDTEKSIAPDVRDVLDVAALLQVTEFHLFHIAYRYWHGRDASDGSIERLFVPYMFRSVVPFWVRQLCRRVLQAHAEGTLDPAEFGLERRQLPADPSARCWRALAVLGAVVAMLVMAASLYSGY